MNFLYPAFLFALVLVLIPIIIHFFNFKRYKTLFFSNVSLIKLLSKKNRKKSQLKQILILLSRIMVVAGLVFAFSRPYFPSGKNPDETPQKAVLIYIDNSLSMKAENENGQLLEQAKIKAIEVSKSYPISTKFLICTNDFSAKNRILLNKDEFAKEITQVTESYNKINFERVFTYTEDIFEALKIESGKTLYIFSDFQTNTGDFKKLQTDHSISTFLVHFKPNPTNNILIDSCWFEIPGRKLFQDEELFIKVKNLSNQAFQNIPIRLYINDSLKAVSNISIAENADSVIVLNYTNYSTNIQLCRVELDDYPVIYDNIYYFSYSVQSKLNALGIVNSNNSGGSVFLRTFFDNDEFILYNESLENNVQVSQFKNYECIFLVNNSILSTGLKTELKNWINQGGTLVVFPEKNSDYSDYNLFFQSINIRNIKQFDSTKIRISEINYTHKIYSEAFRKQEKNSDLPEISGIFSFNNTQLKPDTWLLKLRNGNNALFTGAYGEGNYYIFAFPLNKTNFDFVRHPVFVPTIYNIVLFSGLNQVISYPIDVSLPIKLNRSDSFSEQLIIKNLQTNEEFFALVKTTGNGQKLLITDGINKTSGHFIILDGVKSIQSVSFNNSRAESINKFLSADELKIAINNSTLKNFTVIENDKDELSNIIDEMNNAKQLWKIFLLISFFFLLTEMAIVKFWK